MADSRPVPTPAERERSAIVSNAATAVTAVTEKVFAALQEADETNIAALSSTGAEDIESLHGYSNSSVHQKLYCLLCGADPETFAGGNPKTAITIIRNSQQIAERHWGADIEPYPRPASQPALAPTERPT